MIDTSKYLDARWLEGGRVWPFVDCYGIILEIRHDLGLDEWPAWDGITKQEDGLHRHGTCFVAQRERCEPEAGAVACCYTGSLMTHVAVVVGAPDGLRVAECNPGRGFSCTPLLRFKRRWLRVEFYR
ncbi:hypothetical protein SAMN05216588_12465 [Pseudomonas flavescens]|uniref:Nitrite transporter n=1 Tax=Phytopseudomonas flavescens TaxID=29435 RepID=A0A1G8NCC7_9GAMM|nr:nitrite transporter [Pseudomonas flavescens]SDI77812.1 hypothetical protein SAMN05216588_12465 [Pseudomonas flavescens]